MQNTSRAFGDTPMWGTMQLARVPRLIRLITEMKTNPRQKAEHLYRMLGINRSRYFQDKTLLESALGVKVRFNRAKQSYEILADPYLPIIDPKLSEAFALILAGDTLSCRFRRGNER
jgi:predicted DNA-binding transcriptional regulator YafY